MQLCLLEPACCSTPRCGEFVCSGVHSKSQPTCTQKPHLEPVSGFVPGCGWVLGNGKSSLTDRNLWEGACLPTQPGNSATFQRYGCVLERTHKWLVCLWASFQKPQTRDPPKKKRPISGIKQATLEEARSRSNPISASTPKRSAGRTAKP